MTGPEEFFVWTLFKQLRRRDFALGPDDYELLRRALRAGFGGSSRKELRDVCAALWAKSPEERTVVAAPFDQHAVADWSLEAPAAVPARRSQADNDYIDDPQPIALEGIDTTSMAAPGPAAETNIATATASTGWLPPLRLGEAPALPYEHVFLPQYPVNFRAAAQAWRRLRWPVQEGPATELDVRATIERRSRAGMVTPPVLRPRRRNRARLLLLVDRQGSMAPFHGFVDEVCQAISHVGGLREVARFYFHDHPLEGADRALLDGLGLFDTLDAVFADIPPLTEGEFFADTDLMVPVPANSTLAKHARDAAVLIISDAGAARGSYDLLRVLETVAFLKGLKGSAKRVAWLDALASAAWAPSSAVEIARHLPMFAMDNDGMHRAVNYLRGQPHKIDKPITASAPRRLGESGSVGS